MKDAWASPGAPHGPPILLVVWEAGDLYPHAAAFSNRIKAEAFAATVEGTIIDTFIDVHCVRGESNG